MTVIKNELWRLPWFLNYYRSIGVDEFYFVDNDSYDGSLEYLREQPDVRLFHTDTPYYVGRSGTVWLNHLFSLFTAGWNIYVDVDEALVFQDIEIYGLRGLTNHMNLRGQDIAAGQMVDMFKVESSQVSPIEIVENFITTYPLFVKTYIRWPEIQCPYFKTVGGIRQKAGTGENQTKTPVLRAGRNIQLLSSSHIVSPGVISDVDVGLLHFKFAGDFRTKFATMIHSENRITACQKRHQNYSNYFDKNSLKEEDLDWSTIGRYKNSHSLVDHGVIAPLPKSFGSAELHL